MGVYYDPRYRILVKCLKEYRYESKMTQQELATHLGVSQTYISKYEQCQKRLDVIQVRDICKCLGVNLQDLVRDFEDRLAKEGLS